MGNSIEEHKMNKYNPLTWLLLVVFIPIAIFQEGYNEAVRNLDTIFDWR